MTDSPPTIARHEPLQQGLLVALQGEIDFHNSPRLRIDLIGLLEQQQPVRLILDLSAVPYMDSSGIATIVELLQWQRRRSRTLVLTGLQPKVQSILEITRLDQLFTIADKGEHGEVPGDKGA